MPGTKRRVYEAAKDMGAGWFTTFRRVLLPLIAPGIFIALLLVYVPLFTDFAAPTLVGGTTGYMLGNVVSDLVLEEGNLNAGAAMRPPPCFLPLGSSMRITSAISGSLTGATPKNVLTHMSSE